MTSDAPGTHIPEPMQKVILDFAERAEALAERAHNGGSWFEIYTWLLAMKPDFDVLYDAGMDGMRRTARMRIEEGRQSEILHSFSVPDHIPDEGDPRDTDQR